MTRARALCATAALWLAMSCSAFAANDEVHAVNAYVSALQHHDYSAAYAMLRGSRRTYYKNAANFASVFRVTSFEIVRYRTRTFKRGRVVLDERVQWVPAAQTAAVQGNATIAYTVVRERGGYRIEDAGNPYKAVAPNATGSLNGVRVIVREIAFYPRYIAVTLTLQNVDTGFATFLPYHKSVLTDDRDAVYRSIETNNWNLTDKQLFLGIRLAGNAQYTGTMRFAAPPGADAQELHLEVGPILRDDPNAQPFGVPLPPIATAPA